MSSLQIKTCPRPHPAHLLPSVSSCAQLIERPHRNIGVQRREWFFARPCNEMGGSCCPKPLNKTFLKARGERGAWLTVADFLVLKSFVLAAVQVAQVTISCKPPTTHMSFSVLQQFTSIGMEKCYTFKGQSLENGLPVYFRL